MLLPSPRLPQLFLSIQSPLRQIRCLWELKHKALPLRFLIQQQQYNPSFFHWPHISYEPLGPQSPPENFCPQQQSELPRANRTIFGLGLGISLTSFLSLTLCFTQFHSSFCWTNHSLFLGCFSLLWIVSGIPENPANITFGHFPLYFSSRFLCLVCFYHVLGHGYCNDMFLYSLSPTCLRFLGAKTMFHPAECPQAWFIFWIMLFVQEVFIREILNPDTKFQTRNILNYDK